LLATGKSPCFGTLFPEGDPPRIRAAAIFIRAELSSDWNFRCIQEELTQAFGLMNDIYKSPITLFDDVWPPKKTALTPYDKLFLRVLYDSRMTLGLTGEPLRRLASELIADEAERAGLEIKTERRE
jgi:hypothetical protein